MQGKVKITVIATGFAREEARPVQVREQVPAQPAEPRAARPRPRVALHAGELDFEEGEEGFGPNFRGMKDDLDVPAFLRRQMD